MGSFSSKSGFVSGKRSHWGSRDGNVRPTFKPRKEFEAAWAAGGERIQRPSLVRVGKRHRGVSVAPETSLARVAQPVLRSACRVQQRRRRFASAPSDLAPLGLPRKVAVTAKALASPGRRCDGLSN